MKPARFFCTDLMHMMEKRGMGAGEGENGLIPTLFSSSPLAALRNRLLRRRWAQPKIPCRPPLRPGPRRGSPLFFSRNCTHSEMREGCGCLEGGLLRKPLVGSEKKGVSGDMSEKDKKHARSDDDRGMRMGRGPSSSILLLLCPSLDPAQNRLL